MNNPRMIVGLSVPLYLAFGLMVCAEACNAEERAYDKEHRELLNLPPGGVCPSEAGLSHARRRVACGCARSTSANYLAFIQLASIRLWLRVYEFTALEHAACIVG
jgi:hypothetical protein